jgi:flagellar assembly protein FliH
MRKVALAEIGARGRFVASARYASADVVKLASDPVAEAYQAGFAEGAAMARASECDRQAAESSERRAIELAFARFDSESAALLQDRLRDAVAAICQRMAGEIALDPERLAARVEAASALLRRRHDQRLVRLHPADLAMIAGLTPAGLRIEPDPSLARGQLRVETEDGGVEDGPEQWRAALAEALGPCLP